MTKAMVCIHCADIVSPRRSWQADRSWRWCECNHAAVRWRDGARGLIEVTATHGEDFVRVLGVNNMFLELAVQQPSGSAAATWRNLHELTCDQVEPHYLFHKDNRDCWALLVRPGESGDITFVPYAEAVAQEQVPTAPEFQAGVADVPAKPGRSETLKEGRHERNDEAG